MNDQNNNYFDDLLNDPFASSDQEEESHQESEEKSTSLAPSQEGQSTFDQLPADHQVKAKELSQKISDKDINSVLNYGAAAQKKIGDFSQNVLDHVQNQDTDHIGEILNDLMYQLKEADPKELTAKNSNIFKRIFKKINRSIYETTAKYQMIGAQVDKIASKLDQEKDKLLKDNEMLSELYEKNLDFYEALNVYIAAGELKMDQISQAQLPEAMKEAESGNDSMTVQRVNDLNQFQSRLEKRVHDLKIARQLTIQQAPQIRMIQNTNQTLAEKIQTSTNTAIPLWKNQVVISLTLLRQQEAITAQRQVSETTNEMLKKNSEMLKQSSIDTARENERAVVDIETLEKTQTDLIDTLQEVLAIQKEGHQKRLDAEKRLYVMEDQMKNQLLDLSREDKIKPDDHEW
ncbi:TelA-like protein SA1238 [Alloiococcus otitis]|uniref:Tellurite resistance protein n=1 Tax=Alloiococcus otitis ATCC 51267 TaxID=883081 RepID=K9EB01_9LACT|nr:toxic anion resistance protein [Alloiococcus otitis]EKU94394.1 hypothetical protein HMPREF9698_00122 [Alloiococcus otitis ATCC 51267]SUU81276.1 TelA-like protein SA1238 [Alloiococcus otitis]